MRHLTFFATRFCSALLAFALPCSGYAADTARRGSTETALDRYVAKPDASFTWKKAAELSDPSGTAYVLDMVSQNWLTPAEVDRTEWRHWLTIIKPAKLAHSTALLFVSGGANRPGNPPRPSQQLIEVAKATQSVVAELRMVPNQPLTFHGDGKPRAEDDLIAYTWDQFLRTGDERWPARLPMTKSAVRAMDAITAFLASAAGGSAKVDTFVVAGASKRGWTSWSTAAVDRRVVALAPIVIDVLNTELSIDHHFRAYGFYAPAIGDYVNHHLMDWTGTPELKALYAIEDPFSYRDRLTMPKLLLNACGDQFFLPDSSQFYFGALTGEKFLRYIPNTDHGMKNTDAYQTLSAWYHAILNRTPLPQFSWQRSADGTLTVTAKTQPKAALLWQATNPKARDFRLETLGPVWTSTPVAATGDTYAAKTVAPSAGWTASFIELTFDVGASAPLKLTTDIAVTPDTLPVPSPTPEKRKGFLQHAAKPAH
jgi:PhoPQ-activated pathogenicity-related protein